METSGDFLMRCCEFFCAVHTRAPNNIECSTRCFAQMTGMRYLKLCLAAPVRQYLCLPVLTIPEVCFLFLIFSFQLSCVFVPAWEWTYELKWTQNQHRFQSGCLNPMEFLLLYSLLGKATSKNAWKSGESSVIKFWSGCRAAAAWPEIARRSFWSYSDLGRKEQEITRQQRVLRHCWNVSAYRGEFTSPKPPIPSVRPQDLEAKMVPTKNYTKLHTQAHRWTTVYLWIIQGLICIDSRCKTHSKRFKKVNILLWYAWFKRCCFANAKASASALSMGHRTAEHLMVRCQSWWQEHLLARELAWSACGLASRIASQICRLPNHLLLQNNSVN